jgi:hypothetical protein
MKKKSFNCSISMTRIMDKNYGQKEKKTYPQQQQQQHER